MILLDILLRGEDGWGLLTELKRNVDTCDIPVAIVSRVEDRGKAMALGADAYLVKPIEQQRLIQTVASLVNPERHRRVLIVDDDEVFRYVLRQHLSSASHLIHEAANGSQALALAGKEQFDAILLDLGLPDLGGREVLRRLKDDPDTRAIPVVVVTSRTLADAERCEILTLAAGVLQKDSLSRARAIAAVDEALRGAQGE